MKARASVEVSVWLEAQDPSQIYTTAITQAEIPSGIAIMPGGKKRHAIEEAALAVFTDDLPGRVLAFDGLAASSYAEIFARRRGASTLDLMVAAIAHSHGGHIVTRDVSGFEGFGVIVINPWDQRFR